MRTSPHQEKVKLRLRVKSWDLLDPQELNIACQFLQFAKTEDIRLKSASEGKSSVSSITGETVEKPLKPRMSGFLCLVRS